METPRANKKHRIYNSQPSIPLTRKADRVSEPRNSNLQMDLNGTTVSELIASDLKARGLAVSSVVTKVKRHRGDTPDEVQAVVTFDLPDRKDP